MDFDKVLKDSVEAGTIRPESEKWLRAALDPFHDNRLDMPNGLPDKDSRQSVVMMVETHKTITAPGANVYDVHIASTPVDFAGGAFAGVYDRCSINDGDLLISTGTVGFVPGLVVINAVDSGGSFFEDATGAACAYDSFDSRSVAENANTYRLIGGGFEVVNTTAPLYASGDVTCYRTNNAVGVQAIPTKLIGGTVLTDTASWKVSLPPGELAQATRIPGSKTWEAKEGVYVPFVMDTELARPESTGRMMTYYHPFDDGTNTYGWIDHSQDDVVIPGTTAATSIDRENKHFNGALCSGAIFTGLTPETTLSVIVRAWYEVYPRADDALFDYGNSFCPL
jgi:hypothetical protein